MNNIQEEVDWLFLQKYNFKPKDILYMLGLLFYDWKRLYIILVWIYQKYIKN